eukprot:TRINITY_DN7663_c0_g1_i1.p1 TRINITY_DN7663_c0_g1~~TRINITY_DN7663_c0_g1_i1.p1  ORF type:complete len:173 (+),score=35.90 TRINITY_DN7663_c0_g1_i1:92-610(+)
MSMEVFTDSDKPLRVALFSNVKNAAHLKSAVIEQKLPVALINPRQIADVFLLRLAAKHAADAEQANAMKTRSIYTETLFQLSPSKQIKTALETVGINDSSDSILLATFEDESKAQELVAMVEGTMAATDQLHDMADLAALRKSFKIQPAEEKIGTIVDALTTKMALKLHKNS